MLNLAIGESLADLALKRDRYCSTCPRVESNAALPTERVHTNQTNKGDGKNQNHS